jgi:hypothetical protein
MFYSNEDAVGLKVVLEHDHWTEKGVYACGHIMRIKRIDGLLFGGCLRSDYRRDMDPK